MRSKGFTLIELTMVVAVIGVLAAILLPALARARESGRRASCMANLMNISMAFHAYASEHENQFPWSGGKNNARCLLSLRDDYLPDAEIYICPSSSNSGTWRSEYLKDPSHPLNARRNADFSLRSSYDYFGAYTRAPIKLPANPVQTPRVPVMWDMSETFDLNWSYSHAEPRRNFNHVPGGANLLFLDGSIEFVKAQDLFEDWLPASPEGVAYDDPHFDQAKPDEPTRR